MPERGVLGGSESTLAEFRTVRAEVLAGDSPPADSLWK